jgi:glycosyltransferase involved in cell wall biosynthesis
LSLPFVVTVLDLIPLRFPDLYRAGRPDWRFRFGRFLENQPIRRAAGVLVISESTKRDVRELFRVREERIAVTHLAARKMFRPLSFRDAVRATEVRHLRSLFGFPEGRPVLLYIGGVDPRKNVEFLVEVYADLLGALGPAEERPVLALAGNCGADRNYPRILDAISRRGITDDVMLLGFLTDEELVRAYQCADLFVFPSLYEGFGLPVLEAFACGLPVVAGRNSSLPELNGTSGAAVLLDDGARELWVRELRELLRSPEHRLDMGRSGVLRARDFTWESTARQTLAAYRNFGQLSRRPEAARAATPQRTAAG